MTNHIFFNDGERLLFGERFGYAIEYKLARNETTGKTQVSFAPKIVQSEGAGFKHYTKYELVVECVYLLASEIGKIEIVLYNNVIEISNKDKKQGIANKINDLQKSFINISPTVSPIIKNEIEFCIIEALKNIDIF